MSNKILISISLSVSIFIALAIFSIFSADKVKADSTDFPKDTVKTELINYLMIDSAKPKSLCQLKEQTIWSCTTTKNKIASICASKDVTSEKGYVQYRFGTAGKIELELPQSRTDSQQFFKYSRYTRYKVTMLSLSFTNEDYTYEIHDDNNSEEKIPVRNASIDVSNNEKSSTISCKQPTFGSLMSLEDIVPKDENGL